MHHFKPCLRPSVRKDNCEALFSNANLSVPMQIKYIADPGIRFIPAVAVHPSKQRSVGASLDNQTVHHINTELLNSQFSCRSNTLRTRACTPSRPWQCTPASRGPLGHPWTPRTCITSTLKC